jgi:acetyl-CoA carboxylase biotin carboxyl carrier protein
MAEKKGSAGQGSGMNVDSRLVRELAELLADTGLTEIEVEDGERKIRVARAAPAAVAAPVADPAVSIAAPAAVADAASAPAGGAAEGTVKSPMVGTVFLSPEPGSAPFVKIGDTVKAGDTLLIVEAMKVMNPIAAPSAGTVQEILVSDAQPVEYDQPLIVVS